MYCQQCDNLYDITKLSPAAQARVARLHNQIGGDDVDYDTIIKNIQQSKPLTSDMLDNLNMDNLVQHPSYKKLQNAMKSVVKQTVENLLSNKLDVKGGAYYICRNCGFSKTIDAGTVLVDRSLSATVVNYADMLHLQTLPRTRNYICPNGGCESHSNDDVRKAVFYREKPNEFVVRYVCFACETSWINS